VKERVQKLEVRKGTEGLKTAVFDLDETLIHCNENLQLPYDMKVSIRFTTGEVTEAGINIRPGAIELLRLLKGKYEVMIFTASHSCYANEILNYLDPSG
jgi:CTD small phosphatase-like protein 2